jgi:RHS repeat-associated protein
MVATAMVLSFHKAIADNYAVGDMGGFFNVNESGAATYTLPFDLPDGINGLKPSLGLVYNSQSGNAVAGMGTSIYGTSVITRTPKDIYHDTKASGISYTNNDAYSIDGIRIIQLAQNDFRPENSPLDYISLSGLGFTVTQQNGNTAFYNYKANTGDVTYAWYLSKIVDPFGNTITYNYTTLNGCVYLSSVQYGKNANGSSGLSNIITFNYENRPDAIPYIVKGAKCSMSKRLKSVTIITNNTERNKYVLTYSNSDTFSRLTKIEESYGSVKLPSVTMAWKNIPTFSITAESISSTSDLGKYATSGDFISADLTGNGISDIIQLTDGGNDNTKISIYSASVNNGTTTFSRVTNSANISASFSSPFLLGDMDGNGVSELLAIKAVSTSNSDAISSISNKTRVVSLASGPNPIFTTGNFYNNGKTDIVYLTKSGSGYRCKILNLNGNSIRKAESYLTMNVEPKCLLAGDFNSDGMCDILVIHENGYICFLNQGATEGYSPFSNSKRTEGGNLKYAWIIQPGDFNGDGLADFLTNATDNDNWYFYLNNGNGTFTQKLACTMDVHDNSFTDKDDERFSCIVSDFNNDGKDDLIITKAQYNRKTNIIGEEWGDFQKTYTYWMKSDGSTLQRVKTASSNKDDDALAERFIVGDFNGDGFAELMNYGYDCYASTNANVNSTWRVYQNPSLTVATNKMTSVSVGQSGIYTTIAYATLCDANIYTKGSSSIYPIADLQAPLCVVKQVYQNLAYNSYYTNYKYIGLRSHLRGRGFLGFTTIEANNTTISEKRTNTINSLDQTYYEPSKVTNTITKGGKTATTETSFDFKTSSGYGKCHLTYPQTIKETSFYGEVSTTTNSYDINYRLTEQLTKYDVANMYRQVNYSSYVKAGGTNKPQTVTTKQKHKDDANAFSIVTTYKYDATTGAVTQMVENAVTHEYSYYSFGNLKTHKISASNISPITTTYTYDATNRYVASEKSSANSLITKYTYNTLGRLIKKEEGTSSPFLTTSYTYDAVGNLASLTRPDGTTTTYTRGWGTMPYRRYYVTATTTAQASVTTWYDNLNRDVETTSIGEKGVNVTSTKSYNQSNGNLYSHNYKVGNLTISESYSYNGLGQLTKTTKGTGQTTNYSYSKRSITATQDGNKSFVKAIDPWGNITSVSHNGYTSANYKYSSNGQPLTISYGDVSYQSYTVATMTYDDRGLQNSLTDVDAGTTSYEYDALGRITKQTDARGFVIINSYNNSGLLEKQSFGGLITNYYYDSKLRLSQKTTSNQTIAYNYDDKSRLTEKIYTIDGVTLTFSYVYNSNGQLASQTFPDGMTEMYTYDNYGNLTSIKIGGQRVWELASYSGTQRTAYLGTVPLISTKTLTSKGVLTGTSIKKGSTTLHSFGYTFNGATDNLTQRTGMNGTENFSYDQFDRLTTGTSYALNGNISSKTNIGAYTYDASKKHAVTQVANSGNLIPKENISVSYNALNKVSIVTKGNSKLTITYGCDQQRVKTVLVNGSNTTTTLYADNFELRSVNGTITTYHYVATPDGLAAVYVKKNGVATPYYAETDHLGSIVNLYDANGTKQFSATYDAWGNQTISKNAIGLTRGFTGHEHWNEFGLIDMNGRFYDPLLGRFLSPDPYVQAPENPQNFNRYSYCMNNPLKYNDPDGYKWWHWVIGAASLLDPVSTTITACSTATAGAGIATTTAATGVGITTAVAAVGLTPYQGTLLTMSLPLENSNKKFKNAFKIDSYGLKAKNFKDWVSRFTWESPQTGIGNVYSHFRNIFGNVDRVDYFEGATYCTNEYANDNDGITLGNYININIEKYIDSDFDNYLKTAYYGMFMHEYGHMIQGKKYGLVYLLYIGIPSFWSAKNSHDVPFNEHTIKSHRLSWFERQASAYARDYFGDDWYNIPEIEEKYHPTYGF